MGHLASKDALVKRIRRISGQVQAIERLLTGDADCAKTLHLVAATRGAITGLLNEIIEDHIREHVSKPGLAPDARAEGADQLIAALRRYAK